MGNIWRVFLRDIKRLAKAPAAWSVAFFLCLLPSLYTWFNVAAFWDPYVNTGNLRICVVNEDRGATNETLGDLDLGSQVVGQLHDNNQLDWQFVNRDEAMYEVNSGQAYAAFVIPENFSENVTTIVTGDFQQPTLEYYVNEKTGPVSPKITDTGANSLDTTINDAFFSTVSSTVTKMLNDKLAESKDLVNAKKENASKKIGDARNSIGEARGALAHLKEETAAARQKAADAKESLEGVKATMDNLTSTFGNFSQLVSDANTKLIGFSTDTSSALDQNAAKIAALPMRTEAALSKTAAAISAARTTLDELDTASDRLNELKKKLDTELERASQATTTIDDGIQGSLETIDEYRTQISSNTIPTISSTLASISSASTDLKTSLASQEILVDQAILIVDQLDSTLLLSADAIDSTDRVLASLQDDMALVQSDLLALGASNTLAQIVGDDGIDPDKIADFMMSPTEIVSQELYHVNAYGSAMAPLFINLTLWIGVFMLMVIIRLEVDDEGIERLTITQRFFGRGIILAIMSAIQACVCCTGCLMLGVQTASAPLFYLTAVIASLSYLALQYTLSTTLQHVGKAFCIILVFVQIPGASGLYPIEMIPDFFKQVYPAFPFTYGINAIRETIAGFYGNAWLQNIGVLVVFMVVFTVIGAVARPYLTNLNRMFARQIEESDLINGESVQLPARRYRMSQIIQAFVNREEYRTALDARVTRFMGLYPRLKTGALVAGIGIPIVSTAILMAVGVDKVIILTTWLIWFVLVVAYLITIEYLRDYLGHLMSLDAMTADEVRQVLAQRERYTRVQPARRIWRRTAGEGADAKAEAEAEAGAASEAEDE